ncbi:flagellar basal-body rod protein FlgF [Thermoanaerobacterium sp. DL9XJH110]|uniref:flagellar basal-body rod protein FlgF n=1 Tax=Thermoanaerobacterium sp. DL9XJH110 TaxID=3386643 RepID=UPI003BB72F1B
MLRGLYTSASGMLANMERTDVISNNIANVGTTGFKKDRVIMRAFPEMALYRLDDPETVPPGKPVDWRPFIGVLGTGVTVDEINTNFSQGPIKTTSNPLDLAIEGEGFFEVLTGEGVRYTRDGSFTLDRDGFLVTREGYYVLGENGPIALGRSGDITINERGEIFSDGNFVARLVVVAFPQQAPPAKQGDNLYVSAAQPLPAQARIIQGALEGSNVNSVSEMVDLITAFRAYEANQKAVQAADETLGKAVNDIARI